MSSRFKLAALLLVAVVQLGAAAWSIVRYERTLAHGTPYRIPTAPVDPADAFRGRYVAVEPTITIQKPVAPETEQLLQAVQSGNAKAYVRLATDADGFAAAAEIVPDAPEAGDYLRIERAWPAWRSLPDRPGQTETTGYTLRFSFDRYYMNEAAAPVAERRHRDAARRNTGTRTWLSVRVRHGVGVIEGLFVDGVPIEDLTR